MCRILSRLLVVAALLFAQQAAMAHDFKHLRDASLPHHLGIKCVAFHAVDSALPSGAVLLVPQRIAPPDPVAVALPPSRAPRIEFDSRAPPFLS